MTRFAALATVAVLSAVACDRPAEQTRERDLAARLLNGLFAYPHSTLVSVAAGEDAAQVTLSTPTPVQQVAAWYRQSLTLNGWVLEHQGVLQDGSLSIYAAKGNRPLWLTIKANVGGPGTTYTLVGAQLLGDSAGAQRSGSSMSSNRIQRR